MITWTHEDLDLIYDCTDLLWNQFPGEKERCLDLVQKIGSYIEDRVEPAGYSSVEFTAEDIEAVTGFRDLDTGTFELYVKTAARIGERMAMKLAA